MTARPTPERAVLTPREAGRMLRRSHNAIRRAVVEGRLVAIRSGSRILIPMQTIERLLETGGEL